MLKQCLGVLLGLFVLAAVVSCSVTSESARPGALGLSARQTSWVVRLFGRPPDLVSVLTPYPGMDRQLESRDRSVLGFASERCRQADTYFFGDVDRYLASDNDDYDAGVDVLHRVPAALDPAAAWRGSAQFAYAGRLDSGVRVYREETPSEQHLRIFVLPSSAWIVSHGAIGDRLARVLAADASEPPLLDAAPGSFVDETRPVDAALRRRLANLGWTPELADLDRLVGGGVVAYPVQNGRPLVLGLKLVFSDRASASDAAEEVAHDPRLHDPRFVGIDRVGNAVILKVFSSKP
jgi:hypothetical protein